MSDIMLINLPTGTEKRGLHLSPPHGHMIADGRKSTIAKAKPFDLSGPWILVSGGMAYGTIEVALPAIVGVEEFDKLFNEHRVTTAERQRWWPDSESLYLSQIESFYRFDAPVAVKTYPGMQTVLEEVTFDGEEPEYLEEHCKAVRMVLDTGAGDDLEDAAQETKEAKQMPYDPENPPEKISHLPEKVQRQWVHVFNSCMEEHGDEGRCHQMANGVVKKAGGDKALGEDVSTPPQGEAATAEEKSVAYAFKTFRAQDDRLWLLTWSTNAYQDRDEEIFRTRALEEFVERHAAKEVKGEYWFWHIPGTKFADILWQATVDRFLVEAGPFDDTPIGRKMAEFFSQYPLNHPEIAPEGWGTSHGYYYVPHDRKDGVYDWFEKFETTVLPESVASNQHSPRMEVLTKMNKMQEDGLEAIGGADLVQMVIDTGRQRTAELEEKGVAWKSAETEAPPDTAGETALKETEEVSGEAVQEDADDVKGADVAPQAEGVKELAQQVIAGLDLGGLAAAIKQQHEMVSGVMAKLDAIDERVKGLEDIGVSELSPLIPLSQATMWQASKVIQTEAEEKSADANRPTVPIAITEMAKRSPV